MLTGTELRHFSEAILNPIFFVFLLFCFSLLLLLFKGISRTVYISFSLALISLLLFSTGWVPQQLTYSLENKYSMVKEINPHIQWVVVLGGGHAPLTGLAANQLLSRASINRLVEGVRITHALPAAKLLLSGGGQGSGSSEAEQMATVAEWFAIPKEKIALETTSMTTAEQAIALKRMLGEQPFYLVTSATHMPRAMALCREQGLLPIPAPTDFTYYWHDQRWLRLIVPHPYNLAYLQTAWHEILGSIWAKLNNII